MYQQRTATTQLLVLLPPFVSYFYYQLIFSLSPWPVLYQVITVLERIPAFLNYTLPLCMVSLHLHLHLILSSRLGAERLQVRRPASWEDETFLLLRAPSHYHIIFHVKKTHTGNLFTQPYNAQTRKKKRSVASCAWVLANNGYVLFSQILPSCAEAVTPHYPV